MRCPVFFSVPFALAACGQSNESDRQVDNADAAVATALARPMMVDAQLRGEANRDTLLPPERPVQAIAPPGDGASQKSSLTMVARASALAARGGGAFRSCDWRVRYSYGWAALLPSDVTLPDDARTLEGAGSDTVACRLRILTFATDATPVQGIARFRDLANRGGYSVRDSGDGSGLSAVRARDGAAYVVAASRSASGSTIDLLVNRGN